MTEIPQLAPPIPSTAPRHGQGVTFSPDHGRRSHAIVPRATTVRASGTACRLEGAAGSPLRQVSFALARAPKPFGAPEDK